MHTIPSSRLKIAVSLSRSCMLTKLIPTNYICVLFYCQAYYPSLVVPSSRLKIAVKTLGHSGMAAEPHPLQPHPPLVRAQDCSEITVTRLEISYLYLETSQPASSPTPRPRSGLQCYRVTLRLTYSYRSTNSSSCIPSPSQPRPG
jgi:hypothetical protein